MFLSKKKKNVYPCKPQFYYIKVGCKGLFVMEGYQGHNSNTPYALFHLRYMDVNHALSQSDMCIRSMKTVFWIIPFGYCVPPIKL